MSANDSIADNSGAKKSFTYEIDISDKNIFVVGRIQSGQKKRLKVTNTNEWSHKLCEEVWNVFRHDCAWSFKRADAHANGDVSVIGHCTFKQCDATIEVESINNKRLHVKIERYNENIIHSGVKRRMTGRLKGDVSKMLQSTSAAKVRTELAKSMMKEGDVEPAHLPTSAALRKQKSRQRLGKLASTDPYLSLSQMKQNEYKDCIQDVWINPFVVMYSTPYQRQFYHSPQLNKRREFSVDATGTQIIPPIHSSISEKRSSKSNKPKYQTIYLYTVNLIGDCVVPLAQLLSQRHTTTFLTYWLSIWCSKKPDTICLDQSAALFSACVRAYTYTSLNSTNEYISACMNSLLYNTAPPEVFLRIDSFHFVRIIHGIKQFKKQDPMKVTLFKAVFGVLILCHDLTAARKIILDLFTVMRHRYISITVKHH